MSSDGTLRADEQYCSTCGATIKKQAKLCPECGAGNDPKAGSNTQGQHFCESCGEQIYDETELCPNCGVRQQSTGSGGTDSWDVILYVLGALFILAGLDSIFDPGDEILWGIVTGVFLIAIGTVMLPIVRQQYNRPHSLTSFGTVKTVETHPASAGTCAVCQQSVSDGVRREYTNEFALFGVVLSTNESGSNTYCRTCAGAELDRQTGAGTGGVVSAEEPVAEMATDLEEQPNDRRE